MDRGRPLLNSSVAGLGVAFVLQLAAALGIAPQLGWNAAQLQALLWLFALPATAGLVWTIAGRYAPREMGASSNIAGFYASGGTLATLGYLFQPSGLFAFGVFGGVILILAGGVQQMLAVLAAIPRRGESVVDVAHDPLTKGDDASFMQVRFAHYFLPLGLALVAAAHAPFFGDASWVMPLKLAGYHVMLTGYALIALYGVSHLVVPRLCKVPAIAAGAIKGELHSSLPGILLLAAGFAWSSPGLRIAGGLFLFFGAFVFMGVLGANIMKNKSPTQRVTQQFVYVPWTFAGVFWLLAAVLLGVFLQPAVRTFSPQTVVDLARVHANVALVGGFGTLMLGYLTRLWAQDPAAPPSFASMRWSFYALQASIGLGLYGILAARSWAMGAAAGLGLVALAGWFFILGAHRPGRVRA